MEINSAGGFRLIDEYKITWYANKVYYFNKKGGSSDDKSAS